MLVAVEKVEEKSTKTEAHEPNPCFPITTRVNLKPYFLPAPFPPESKHDQTISAGPGSESAVTWLLSLTTSHTSTPGFECLSAFLVIDCTRLRSCVPG